jgi:hypothetical protein
LGLGASVSSPGTRLCVWRSSIEPLAANALHPWPARPGESPSTTCVYQVRSVAIAAGPLDKVRWLFKLVQFNRARQMTEGSDFKAVAP